MRKSSTWKLSYFNGFYFFESCDYKCILFVPNVEYVELKLHMQSLPLILISSFRSSPFAFGFWSLFYCIHKHLFKLNSCQTIFRILTQVNCFVERKPCTKLTVDCRTLNTMLPTNSPWVRYFEESWILFIFVFVISSNEYCTLFLVYK